MTDIHALRESPGPARVSQRARGGGVGLVDRILEADTLRRANLQEFESLHASQKGVPKSVDKTSEEERPVILAKARELAEQVRILEACVNKANVEADHFARLLPNLILDGVPAGGGKDSVVLHHEGLAVRDFAAKGFKPAGRLVIGEGLDAIDTRRGAEVSGTRFYYLKETSTRLELTLTTMTLGQTLATDFVPVMTPILMTPQMVGGTGFLSERSREIYYLPADGLYFTDTSEVALAGYHSDEVLDLSAGPRRCLSWSTCYRREAGSTGKDTRGAIRVHRFNKAEMSSHCRPEEAAGKHERFLTWEEEMLRKVELPYRVIDMTAGDLGTSATRKLDYEAWLPIQSRYMEVTSTSNYATFQTRRLGVRERRESGIFPVMALGGTLATIRWLVAVLENHQLADGSLRVPEALYPYLGRLEVLEPIK